jgi:hypothetical protein
MEDRRRLAIGFWAFKPSRAAYGDLADTILQYGEAREVERVIRAERGRGENCRLAPRFDEGPGSNCCGREFASNSIDTTRLIGRVGVLNIGPSTHFVRSGHSP